ncbi:uncharacterized protein YcfJ [Methylopila capsulata]|uniref:Uncharacterized protein YcfJ n=1 Tax=Methylopila capsulata TaxID=61654 RepID=A0A9W6IRC3_9HYPH|nr:DUF1236 domain-containing protein [Methylopila capsulata]MBM7849808.1 uncharacterized protein YcfJ [Methylopila capsulata]GLK55097.1 hypothetical protein GCM10008170_11160 [Methylopila capsulata]
MRKGITAFVLALGVALPTASMAQEGTAAGVAGGAATGAVLGGPVGAAAGAVAGGVAGTLMAPPKQVKEYVVRDERPSIAYEGEVVVGKPLPETVEVYRVPDSDYSYTVVNDRRYIIDDDRTVVEIVE